MGYDNDAVLMNKAIQKFFGHSEKYSQRTWRLKKIRYEGVMKEKKEGNTWGECVAVKTRPQQLAGMEPESPAWRKNQNELE